MSKINASRDEGLTAAIRAAGSISRLAQLVGVSQPAVSEWKRVPVHRVVQVEQLTGLSRDFLRPDIFAPPRSTARN
ncbi:MAG: transcriptional regulator [Hyphomicrobiaceae bacterium]|jgi:DNA-binding transcriptional regulator YdaS (Cro superfamily)